MATSRIMKKTTITTSLLAMLAVMSACSSSGISLLPSDVRATLAADAASESRKITVDEVLARARNESEPEGGKTVLAKTNKRFSSFFKRKKKKGASPALAAADITTAGLSDTSDPIAAFLGSPEAEPDSVIAKTSPVDTIETAAVSAHTKRVNNAHVARAHHKNTAADGGLTNASIAQGWVETGPEDLEGLPVDGFANEDNADRAPWQAHRSDDADVLFSDYLERTEVQVGNDDEYNRTLQRAQHSATYEQDPKEVFEMASRIAGRAQPNHAAQATQTLSPNELVVRSKALAARNTKRTPKAANSNNELLARARALVTGGIDQRSAPVPTTTILRFEEGQHALTNSGEKALQQFIKAHADRKISVEAGLSGNGNAFEKLATAQARLSQLTKMAPTLERAERTIKPELEADTLRLSITQ